MSIVDPKAIREEQEKAKKRHQQYVNSLPIICYFRFWYPKDPERNDYETWIMANNLEEAEARLYERAGLVNITEYEERVCRVYDISIPLCRKLYKMWKPKFEAEKKAQEDKGIFGKKK